MRQSLDFRASPLRFDGPGKTLDGDASGHAKVIGNSKLTAALARTIAFAPAIENQRAVQRR